MSALQEKIRRLSEISAAELRFRIAQKWRIAREQWSPGRNGANGARPEWWQAWDPEKVSDAHLRKAIAAGRGEEAAALLPSYIAVRATPHFFFEQAGRGGITGAFREAFPARVEELRAEAEAICEHRFRIFAYPEVACGAEIPWRRDLVHGKQTALEHWSRVPYLNFKRAGDSKIVWEPNRHQHFVTLGQAWLLTGDERYAEECMVQWEHWQRENPYGRGINWASSLEVSFRAWSWLWAMYLLNGSRALTGPRLAAMIASLGGHAAYIAENLSVYFSPNTHLLGEGFALFAIGLLLPELRGAEGWRETGYSILLEQIHAQVLADGTHVEQSSYYHRYATDFFQCAAILADRNACSFPAAYCEQLERMAEMILHTALPSGLHPMTGDADGGRLLPFGAHHPNDQRGALSTAAAYFRRGDFRQAAGTLYEETLWLMGTDAAQVFSSLEPATPREVSRAFPEAGMGVMRSDWNGRARMLLFDAGPQGLAGCAHGHADALSVICSADGVEWLVDPGTYVYTSSRAWREAFRGTRGHNTVTVDGRDQAEPVDFFKYRDVPQPRLERWASLASLDLAIGSHNGYERLSPPVTHRRTIIFVKPDYWLISDELAGDGAHQFDFQFHFAPGVKVEGAHGDWLASKAGSRLLLVPPAQGVAFRVAEGDANGRQGWSSADYGHREPAPVLLGTAQVTAPQRYHWLLWPMPAAWARIRELPGPGLRVAVETDAYTDYFAVRGQQIESGTGEIYTDAELLFLRREKSGLAGRLVMVNGCCAENNGQSLVRADSMFDAFEALREGSELEIRMRPARRFRLYAPGVGSARVNGAEAAFERRGDWIEFRT